MQGLLLRTLEFCNHQDHLLESEQPQKRASTPSLKALTVEQGSWWTLASLRNSQMKSVLCTVPGAAEQQEGLWALSGKTGRKGASKWQPAPQAPESTASGDLGKGGPAGCTGISTKQAKREHVTSEQGWTPPRGWEKAS